MGVRTPALVLLGLLASSVAANSTTTSTRTSHVTSTVVSTSTTSMTGVAPTFSSQTTTIPSSLGGPDPTILQPPGTNTVTPWAVTVPTPEASGFPDVTNPWAYPTPGPWNSTLDPNLVGNGSQKDIRYSLSVGGVAGVVVGALLLIGVSSGVGYYFWRRNKSIKLGETQGKGDVTYDGHSA